MIWEALHPKLTPEHLGLLPGMLDEFYDYSWVCIIQKDRSFEICRMD